MYRTVSEIKEGFLVYTLVGVLRPQKSANAKISSLPLSPFPVLQHILNI